MRDDVNVSYGFQLGIEMTECEKKFDEDILSI